MNINSVNTGDLFISVKIEYVPIDFWDGLKTRANSKMHRTFSELLSSRFEFSILSSPQQVASASQKSPVNLTC